MPDAHRWRVDGGRQRRQTVAMDPKLTTRELTSDLWLDLEALFGSNGACGGCWCMFWRQARGEDWSEIKGAVNKRRFRALVEEDRAHGVLAYVDGVPVGWAAFDRRRELGKLDRAPSLACDDADRVWSLPCFFVKAGHRRQGVASALIAAAVAAVRRRGGTVVEAYPVRPGKFGKSIPAAFAYTGTIPMFEAAGFQPVGERDRGKQRMRLKEKEAAGAGRRARNSSSA
ncbi:GNAT family N-acetyltransferase [Reyranella sp.]|uniref:GNAT family N-acetyltransferase n=1 Tax=Reyranella sp. TaxID=1929291 RepID=UPI0037830D52